MSGCLPEMISPAHGKILQGMLALPDAFAAAGPCAKANQLHQLMWTAAASHAMNCLLMSGPHMKAFSVQLSEVISARY